MKNTIWIINIVLLIVVVFLGVEQGGIGAKISFLEKNIISEDSKKSEIAENLFKGQELKDESKILELGFVKPDNIIYFDTEEAVAKLPVQ